MINNKEKKKFNIGYLMQKDTASIFTVFALTAVFVLVIILSFGTRFYFKPGVDESFWGDLAFAFALLIYCMYFGISESTRHYEKREGGEYQTAIADFKAIREKTKVKDFKFDQWLNEYYKKELKDYHIALITSKGSSINPYVLDLDYHEIDKLNRPFLKHWENTEFEGRKPTYFRTMTDKQLIVVQDIMRGKYSFPKLPDSYFKTYDTKASMSDYLEETKASKKDSLQTVMLVAYRIVLLFITNLVFAIFGIKMAQSSGAEQTLQNLYDMFSRIINMCSAFSWGFMVGRTIVKRKSARIRYKTLVNDKFESDKKFVAKTEEEVAKEEYDEYHKNVVDAEIVEPETIEQKELALEVIK